ncbi:glycosyltransferase family 2 protein [Candidatus Uhrbacteria bacterium]|jgi:GT2 family glycosyltransferase|nr:glycosyltransferase family 2 protein [Candidatus Uhrbacteria bacterium]
MRVDVSIIVVTYKERLDVLKNCFDSVAASQSVSYELIVVDNAASDTTRGLLESYDNVTYLRNESNRGFAAAVNRGMAVSQGRYVLLLNPDVRFEPDALASMLTHLDENGKVGIASCVIQYPNGDLQESIRRFPTVADQLAIMLKLPHVFKHLKSVERYMMRDKDPYKTQDVDSIMGAFMWIRRELIEQIGFLDERYFIWFEEVDYCKMAVDHNWLVRHYADVSIEHHKGHMFDQIGTVKKQKWVRESLRKYMDKHHGTKASLIFWILTPIFIAAGYLSAWIKGK